VLERQLALALSSLTVSLVAALLGFYVSKVTGSRGYALISMLWLSWALYLAYKLARGKRLP
jgi:hypothetical protein